jgi:hypothetical protein
MPEWSNPLISEQKNVMKIYITPVAAYDPDGLANPPQGRKIGDSESEDALPRGFGFAEQTGDSQQLGFIHSVIFQVSPNRKIGNG